MTQIERDTLDHEESERENDACQRHSTHPDKDVLKTTSPIFVPSAPNAFPCHTEPSSKTNLQGFWTSHGFEIAAKHRTPALPLLFDDDDEVEVEHEALFFKDVLPTRPLNCVDTKLAWWWWCAEQDDIAKARLFYVFFFCSKSSFEMTRRRRVNNKEEGRRRKKAFFFSLLVFESHAFNPNVEDGECCLSFFSLFFFTRFFFGLLHFLLIAGGFVWERAQGREIFFFAYPFCDFMCTHTRGISFLFGTNHHQNHHHNLHTHLSLSLVSYVDRARAYYLYTWIK